MQHSQKEKSTIFTDKAKKIKLKKIDFAKLH